MQTVSHYRILSKLGEGGMGSVYLAHDELLQRNVAIKFPTLSEGAVDRARFLREARLASALNHPGIAAIYDCGETDEHQPFLVMELVTGEPLSKLLGKSPPSIDRTIEIVTEIATALGEAHRRGIVHRDVKPSNVMITESGAVKVLDFGLAKQMRLPSGDQIDWMELEESTTTIPGTVMGTPLYMSPEQARGEKLDARSDIFSLGILLYQCLTGRPPFLGSSLLAIGAQILHADPRLPSQLNPQVSSDLDRVALKTLAKNSAERYQTVDELITDLSSAPSGLSSFETVRSLPSSESLNSTADPSLMLETNITAPAARTDEQDPYQSARVQLYNLTRRYWWVAALIVILSGVFWFVFGRRSASIVPPSPAAMRAYEQGMSALRDGAYLKANKILAHAVEVDGGFALAHARLAESWTELDNIDKASFEIASARSLAPDVSVLSAIDGHYLLAINDTVVGNRTGAIDHYREIAKLEPDKAYVYFDLGRAYERNRQFELATEHHLEALKKDAGYPAAHLRLGILSGRKQAQAEALKYFDEAEKLYRTFSNLEGVTEVVYQRGLMFFNLRKMAEARSQFQTALAAAKGGSPSEYQEIRALLQLSSVSGAENDFAEAEALSAEAIALARKKGIEYLTTLGLINLGNVYRNRNLKVEAEKYIEEGLALARRYKTTRYEALALAALGNIRIDQTRFDEGLKLLEQARDFFERSGYRKQAWDLRILIGRTERDRGDHQAALLSFNEQLRSAEQAADQASIGQAHDEIGKVLMRLERSPEAVDHFSNSLAIHRAQGNRDEEFYSLINRAQALADSGYDKRAQELITQATSLASDGALKADFSLTQARLALIQQSYSLARARGNEALREAIANDPSLIGESKLVLGQVAVRAGSAREGLKLCQEALDLAVEVKNPRAIALGQLALSEALLVSGEGQKALETALEAQRAFGAAEQRHSEWRAWLIAAMASRRMGNETRAQEFAMQSNRVLSLLEQQWKPDDFQSYSKRPDVHHTRQQLDELLVAKP